MKTKIKAKAKTIIKEKLRIEIQKKEVKKSLFLIKILEKALTNL